MNNQYNIALGMAFVIGIVLSAIFNPLIAVSWFLIAEVIVSYREKKQAKHVTIKHK